MPGPWENADGEIIEESGAPVECADCPCLDDEVPEDESWTPPSLPDTPSDPEPWEPPTGPERNNPSACPCPSIPPVSWPCGGLLEQYYLRWYYTRYTYENSDCTGAVTAMVQYKAEGYLDAIAACTWESDPSFTQYYRTWTSGGGTSSWAAFGSQYFLLDLRFLDLTSFGYANANYWTLQKNTSSSEFYYKAGGQWKWRGLNPGVSGFLGNNYCSGGYRYYSGVTIT